MPRSPHSHKGQNGTVAIVGGSPKFHGAPIFSSLAAEASGVDLLYPFVHREHVEVTKAASLNFIVSTFQDESLSVDDGERILSLLQEVHSAVVGPGLADTVENEEVLRTIVARAPCSLVLDACALRPGILQAISLKQPVVLTPHLGELETMVGRSLTGENPSRIADIVKEVARTYGATVILKGWEDIIVSPKGKLSRIRGGNAGLTKGGTGDALAGLVAGLLAQGVSPFDACVRATTVIKKAGAFLFKTRGYAYTTREVIGEMPRLVKAIL